MITYKDITVKVADVLADITTFLLPFAVLLFLWFVFQLIQSNRGGDGKRRTESIKKLMMSVIALAVLFSIWGILEFLKSVTIDIDVARGEDSEAYMYLFV